MKTTRAFVWAIFILSIVGSIFSIFLIGFGSQPCSGDGCLVRILLYTGILIFIPSVLLVILIFKKNFRKK